MLAVDGIHDPEVLCVNAASTALALSNLPWNGPIGCVRVGLIEDKVVVAPTRRDLANSSLNMLVTAAGQNLVIMLEAAADDVLQPDFLKAIKTGVSFFCCILLYLFSSSSCKKKYCNLVDSCV